MAERKDLMGDVEEKRLQLEDSLRGLQSSLRHWQTWEAEYEGMKEEISKIEDRKDPANVDEQQNGHDIFDNSFEGALLTPQEIKSMLRDSEGSTRSKEQVIGLLTRRLDYVGRNIKSISSLTRAKEKDLRALDEAEGVEEPAEDSLPLTEICEELDEEGNIISTSLSVPEQAASSIVQTLQQVDTDASTPGAEAIPIISPEQTNTPDKPEQQPPEPPSAVAEDKSFKGAGLKAISGSEALSPRKTPDKRVSFANGTKHESKPESDADTLCNPVIPDGESQEDAALRRQMIRYNMEEVGNVVAEMNIEDDEDDSDLGEWEDGSLDDDDEDGEDEEEDAFGRASTRVLTDDYLAEMQALERKLNANAMVNLGPDPPTVTTSAQTGFPDRQQSSTLSTTPPIDSVVKKGVRFAEELDIKQLPPKNTISRASQAKSPTANIQEILAIERELPDPSDPSVGKAPPNPTSSQLKPQPSIRPVPGVAKPPSKIQAATIVERPFVPSTVAPPSRPAGPDELDPTIVNQQVTTEYHRLRNRQIMREGGFRAPDDDNEVVISPDESGPKKVSRFKAARLGR